jgi:phenylalanyl-tRNA synthetase beta chain
MICSAHELRIGEDHAGIIVLPADAGEPGQDARPVLGLGEEVIEFEINPDRSYALSLRGVAREAAMAFDTAYTDPCRREVPAAKDDGYPVRVEDAAGCPVFVARTITGFDPTAPTPDWLARRVRLAGMRPISLAVDVTNYVMLETGRPIHGYDGDKLEGSIVVRRAKAGERLTTLDGTDRSLSTEDLVVCDDSGVIGLGGVMGGETTEMSDATTTVVIEAAHWDPVAMFRTGKRHRLTSEAGKRNERGVDPTICEVAADRVAELLTTYGGGTVSPGVTVVGTPPAPDPIRIPASLPERVAGFPISRAETERCLRAVGATVDADAEADGDALVVTPPPWRPDLTDPYDLVEEVVRVVGYDRVPSLVPLPPVGRGLTREQRLRRRIGRTLASLGCVEVVSFPFVGDDTFDALGLPDDDVLRHAVRLSNPLSAERPLYTTTLIPGVLDAAARNLGRGAPGVSLFETGTVAFPADRGPAPVYGVEWRPSEAELEKLFEAIPEQPLFLAAVLSGERDPAGWWGAGRPADWSDAIDLVRQLGRELGVSVEVRPASRMPWHPSRCARVLVGGEEFGHAGELHPRVCRAYAVPRGTAALEVDLDFLMERAVDVPQAPTYSHQPLAKEDVALVVEDGVSAVDVEAALRAGAGELLESVRLFDVYTGPQVGEGKKSLAFALRFRAPDRTLTEAETGAARDAAVAAAAAAVGAVQR